MDVSNTKAPILITIPNAVTLAESETVVEGGTFNHTCRQDVYEVVLTNCPPDPLNIASNNTVVALFAAADTDNDGLISGIVPYSTLPYLTLSTPSTHLQFRSSSIYCPRCFQHRLLEIFGLRCIVPFGQQSFR